MTTMGTGAFYGSSLIIYCEDSKRPNGWSIEWTSCPVVWNYKDNEVASDGYIYTFVDGVRYGIKDGVASVARQPKNIAVANVAENITYKDVEYRVTQITDHAFTDCKSLTSIEIPDSVTTIGTYAFYNCSSLTSVDIPDSVTSIGEKTFQTCDCLTIYCEAASKPSSWNSNWNYYNRPVVWDCNNNDVATDGYIYTVIEGIRYGIKDEVATVVRQSSNIATAKIFDSITYKSLEYNVTTIAEEAFRNCANLTSVAIGENITTIEDKAFLDCQSLSSVYITNIAAWCKISFDDYNTQPLYYAKNLYLNNVLLTELVIPSNVTSISSEAFQYCNSLTSVVIPDSVTSIGNYAFSSCSRLTSVVIGDSVTRIGDSAFSSCSRLTSITFDGTIAEWVSINKANNRNSNVPATEVICSDGRVKI